MELATDTGAAIGKLHDHRLMQQVRARLGTEDRLVKRRLYDVNFHCPYLLIAGRRMTTPRWFTRRGRLTE